MSEFKINWGDGETETTNSLSSLTHVYLDTKSEHEISVSGDEDFNLSTDGSGTPTTYQFSYSVIYTDNYTRNHDIIGNPKKYESGDSFENVEKIKTLNLPNCVKLNGYLFVNNIISYGALYPLTNLRVLNAPNLRYIGYKSLASREGVRIIINKYQGVAKIEKEYNYSYGQNDVFVVHPDFLEKYKETYPDWAERFVIE